MSLAAELPTRRNEAWKYSDLRAAAQGTDGWDLTPGWHKVALTTDSPDVRSSQVAGGDTISALVRSVTNDGTAHFIVKPNQSRSIHLDWEILGGVGGHAVEVLVEDGANLALTEAWIGEANAFGVGSLILRVSENASVTRTVVQRDSTDCVIVSGARIHLDRGARFKQFILAEGGKLARVETFVEAQGEGAEIELNGVYLANPGRHADLTSTIEMGAENGVARQLIKGVARKGGRGVFQGKIVVARGAQKTDARQYHKGMLLEDGAEIFAKPELLIFADDVQCAHGNTAGGLNAQELFYLRSRGIPELEARSLLIEAFLGESVPDWAPPDVREEILGRIAAWLGSAA